MHKPKAHAENAAALLDKIAFLFDRYSNELRATTQPYTYQRVTKHVPHYEYQPEDALVRETHMEHIGSLPIVATELFPYLNDPDVDLGQTLLMLAIHDIGEIITGDQMTFTKKAGSKEQERVAALSLLHGSYHAAYDEAATQSTASGKFAKAVDKITPDIIDYLTPAEISIWRYKHFVGKEPHEIIATIEQFKRPFMLWNPFMTEFHIQLLDRLAAKLRAGSQK